MKSVDTVPSRGFRSAALSIGLVVAGNVLVALSGQYGEFGFFSGPKEGGAPQEAALSTPGGPSPLRVAAGVLQRVAQLESLKPDAINHMGINQLFESASETQSTAVAISKTTGMPQHRVLNMTVSPAAVNAMEGRGINFVIEPDLECLNTTMVTSPAGDPEITIPFNS